MIVLLQRWWLPRCSVSREVSLSAFSVWFRLCGIYLLLVTRWAFNLVKISFGLYFHWLRWPIDRVWSCKQAQKLHVCAIVRRAVTCCLTVSFSFFCRLLSMNCSHISFVSPKHSSLNLFTTICVTWNFLKKNVFVHSEGRGGGMGEGLRAHGRYYFLRPFSPSGSLISFVFWYYQLVTWSWCITITLCCLRLLHHTVLYHFVLYHTVLFETVCYNTLF